MPDPVVPKLGAEAFSCPHCGALAHQTWYRLALDQFERDQQPFVLTREHIMGIDASKMHDDDDQKLMEQFQARFKKNDITIRQTRYAINSYAELVNAWVCRCYACGAFTFWVKDRIVHPITKSAIKPHEDLPASLRDDFEEAVAVLDLSPRSSAALLRLCIQKLMVELDQKGKDLNADIGALVKQGLDPNVQMALDVVRVIGNNAVHPGQIDLKDDKRTAVSLFQLLDLIIERCITVPKKLGEMYANLPPSALEAIEKRDKD